MSEQRPIIFLDFDGVLNNDAWLDRASIHWSENHDYSTLLSPTLAARVQRIADAAGAVIVVSSAQRFMHPPEDIEAFLRAVGVTAPVVGYTPRKMSLYSRGDEIALYIEQHGASRFVILDDNPDAGRGDLQPYFVETDPLVGITDEDVKKAIAIISGENNVGR